MNLPPIGAEIDGTGGWFVNLVSNGTGFDALLLPTSRKEEFFNIFSSSWLGYTGEDAIPLDLRYACRHNYYNGNGALEEAISFHMRGVFLQEVTEANSKKKVGKWRLPTVVELFSVLNSGNPALEDLEYLSFWTANWRMDLSHPYTIEYTPNESGVPVITAQPYSFEYSVLLVKRLPLDDMLSLGWSYSS